MFPDLNLAPLLWRAWFFRGFPEAELETFSLYLARLLTLAGCVSAPLVLYFSVYREFNAISLLFPMLVMAGFLISSERVDIAPKTRLLMVGAALLLVAMITGIRHGSLFASLAALICASHILLLAHGFRVAVITGVFCLLGLVVILVWVPAINGARDHLVLATFAGGSWLLLGNVVLATAYDTVVTVRNALISSNERLVRKLFGGVPLSPIGETGSVGTALRVDTTGSAIAAGISPTNFHSQNLQFVTLTELFDGVFDDLMRGSSEIRSTPVRFHDGSNHALAYAMDASRLSSALSRLVISARLRPSVSEIKVDVVDTPLPTGRHRLSLMVEDDGVALPAADAGVLENRDLPSTKGALAAESHVILASKWLRECGAEAKVQTLSPRGNRLVISFSAESCLSAERTSQVVCFPPAPLIGKVLVVDDDATVRKAIKVLVEREFHSDVLLATSAIEALQLMADVAVDLVIADYFMPGMDGAELIQLLRQAGQDTPVVAITTATAGVDQDKLWLAGADVVLSKPFTATALAHLVHRYLYA